MSCAEPDSNNRSKFNLPTSFLVYSQLQSKGQKGEKKISNKSEEDGGNKQKPVLCHLRRQEGGKG